MIKKIILIGAISCSIVLTAYGQVYVTGDKTIGSTLRDNVNKIIETPDNGFLIIGSSEGSDVDITDSPNGNRDFLIIKTDSAANIQWNRLLGSSSFDDARNGVFDQVGGDGYVIVGNTDAGSANGDITSAGFGNRDIWLIKLSLDGNTILWQTRLGGNRQDKAVNIIQTTDGGYVVTIDCFSDAGTGNIGADAAFGNQDVVLIKVDPLGNIVWQKRLGGSSFDNIEVLLNTSDGGYVAGIESQSGASGLKTTINYGNKDIWIVKFDNAFNILWQQSFGGTADEELNAIMEDGTRLVIVGMSESNSYPAGNKSENSFGGADIYIVKLFSGGGYNWDKTIGGNLNDEGEAIVEDADGHYIIAASSESNITGIHYGFRDNYITKIDRSNGNLIWHFNHGGDQDDNIRDMIKTSDGGLLTVTNSGSAISGNKTSGNNGDDDVWIAKLNGDPIQNTRYSLSSGTWRSNDNWSLTPGGPPCCYPDQNSFSYVQPGHTMSLDNDAFSYDLTVQSGGNIVFGADYQELKIYDSLIVENNASISIDPAFVGTDIEFRGNKGHLVINDAVNGVNVDYVKYFNPGYYTISGTGKLSVDQDIFLDSAVHWTNNLMGEFDLDELIVYRFDTIINNATVNMRQLDPVRGDFYFENNAKFLSNGIRYDSGLFNTHFINYDTIITNSDIFISHGNILFENYGYLYFNGTRAVDNTSNFHNYTGATMVITGGWPDRDCNMHFHYPDNQVIYTNAGGQQMYQSVSGYWNLDLLGGGEKHARADLHILGDLSIHDSCRLDIAHNDFDAWLHGDILITTNNTSPFDNNNQIVSIVGTGDQHMQHTARITFDELVIDKPSGKFITDGALLLQDSLALNNGVISNGGPATIEDNIKLTGGGVNSHFEGQVIKEGNDPFTFHLGKNGKYRPLSISDVGHNTFAAEYIDEDPHPLYDISQRDHAIDDVSYCEYWTFDRLVGTEDVSVTINWGADCGLTPYERLNVARWNGSRWVNEGHSAISGDLAAGSITSQSTFHRGIVALAQVTYPPILVEDAIFLVEDGSVFANVLTNDYDQYGYNIAVNGSPLTIPQHGNLTFNPDGSFTYTPEPNFFGVDTLRYEVCNDYTIPKCDTANVVLWVRSANDLPVGRDSTIMIMEDSTYQFNAKQLITNVTNYGTSTYQLDWLEVNKNLYIDEGYRISNLPAYLQGTQYIRPANADRVQTVDQWLEFDLTEPGYVYVLFDRRHNLPPGWLSDSLGWELRRDTIHYTGSGEYKIVYARHFDAGHVIMGGNRSTGIDFWSFPRMYLVAFGPDSYSQDVFAIQDIDNHPFRQIRVESFSGGGSWLYNNNPVAPGSIVSDLNLFKFQAAVNENGNGYSTLNFSVGDGFNSFSATSNQIVVNVNPVNDKPSFMVNDITVNEDAGPQEILGHIQSITDGDSELMQNLQIFIETDNQQLFSAVPVADVVSGHVNFTTAADSFGVAQVKVWINDDGLNTFPHQAYSDTLTFNLNIVPVNDAPIAVADTFSINVNGMLNGNLILNDYDIENDPLVLSTTAISAPLSGNVTLNPDGSFTYNAGNMVGADTFTYQVCDQGTPSLCHTAVVYISLYNNPPVAFDHSQPIYQKEESQICLNATDPDGNDLFIGMILLDSMQGKVINVDSAALCFSILPEFGVDDSEFSFQVLVCDAWDCDTAMVTIQVHPDITIIYQALSPNNDGYNDTWIIDGIENYPDNEVKIFNRYGDLVYAAQGYNNLEKIWKGNSNQALVLNKNADLPEGTYFYTISMGNGSRPKSGYVVIAR